ncbi:hypothetical protein B0J12DRAFT_419108 [Macrophomina phaseolina]|uniref:Uncharacterized protein n=1 Tax=Macrophomina phaseolina TaxID=35725 RepID=A0ABQ8FRA5_9PEZI|nr:hypothetical protein B0J12DRAFT_419108 [Macrophomina phaseolina]
MALDSDSRRARRLRHGQHSICVSSCSTANCWLLVLLTCMNGRVQRQRPSSRSGRAVYHPPLRPHRCPLQTLSAANSPTYSLSLLSAADHPTFCLRSPHKNAPCRPPCVSSKPPRLSSSWRQQSKRPACRADEEARCGWREEQELGNKYVAHGMPVFEGREPRGLPPHATPAGIDKQAPRQGRVQQRP